MSSIIDGFLFAWNKNRDYGAKLVADLDDHQMQQQPAPDGFPPANHPAWVLSHLNVYLPIIEAIIGDEAFDDPKEHPFGMLSKPETTPGLYASRDDLVSGFLAGHDRVSERLRASDESVFGQSVKLPRWQSVMPTAGIALPYLMFNHENGHLGQVSAWRRIQGLPSVG